LLSSAASWRRVGSVTPGNSRPGRRVRQRYAENQAPNVPSHEVIGVGWVMGFEPTTIGTTIRRSTKLSYTHHERERKPQFNIGTPWGCGTLWSQHRHRDRHDVGDVEQLGDIPLRELVGRQAGVEQQVHFVNSNGSR